MFTGIITDLGQVRDVTRGEGGTRLVIGTGFDLSTVALGASICCSGVCLTVVETGPDVFAVDVSRETLRCTTLDAWAPGTPVNLERSLCLGDELGGHIVSGHVDGVATVKAVVPEGDSHRFTFTAPADLAPLVAAKGSVALDGVSLTVNRVDQNDFDINVIPHTRAVTTFGHLQAGDRVNMEVDMLARYVARLLNRE